MAFLSIPVLSPHSLRKNLRGSEAAWCGQKKKREGAKAGEGRTGGQLPPMLLDTEV